MTARDLKTLTNAMVAAGSVLLREAGRLFRGSGVTAAHFNVLSLLADEKRGLRPSDLSAALVVDPSSTTYVLDQMESRKWLRRVRDLGDRRGYRVVVTPRGRKIYRQVSALYDAALTEMGRTLSAQQAKAVTEMINQIRETAPTAVETILAAANRPSAGRKSALRSRSVAHPS